MEQKKRGVEVRLQELSHNAGEQRISEVSYANPIRQRRPPLFHSRPLILIITPKYYRLFYCLTILILFRISWSTPTFRVCRNTKTRGSANSLRGKLLLPVLPQRSVANSSFCCQVLTCCYSCHSLISTCLGGPDLI
jgi:hypothetical protein